MVYAFVRQSGGSIRIDSSVGCGTTFTILLPAVDLFGVIEQAPTEGPGFAELKEHALVLLVEDDREVRRVIRRQLQGLNCMVLESSSGFEGLILELLSPKAGISSEIKIIVLNQSFSAHDTSCIWPSAAPDQFPLSEAAAAGLAVNLFIKGYFSCWLRNAMQYSWGILFNY